MTKRGIRAPGFVRRALEAHRQGALDEAAALYAKALKREPGCFEALHWLGCLRFQQGRAQEALKLLAAALETDPASVMGHANLGNVLGATGDLGGALKSFEQALSLEPGCLIALNGRGAALARLGLHADAVANYDAALQIQPDARVLGERAAALMELDRAQEALADAEAALALEPGLVRALIIRGNAFRASGRLADALASYDEVLAIDANDAAALYNRGLVLGDLGQLIDALESFGRALELRPHDAQTLHSRGSLLLALRQPEAALRDFDAAIAITPAAELLNDRANILKSLHRDEEAMAGYDAAIAASPDCAEAHDNRGVLLLELGRLGEAAEAIETSIRLAPKRVRGYYDLTLVRPVTADEPYLPALEILARDADALPAQERIELDFALAKAFADLGDHDAAFARLLDANALKRAVTRYDEAATLATFDRAREIFTPAFIRSRSGQGHPSRTPIFIIGMPRSGTSLVEQVLASHPEVFGGGETDVFANAAARVLQPGADPAALLSGPELVRLGELYLERIAGLAPG
ncbi:MAG TPA: tetratricopeptide repeat protein, partial [Caulobacteraceae bacterium]|nr:tetratricopeptide repeat protein [Caulobacteraceae bacterium]